MEPTLANLISLGQYAIDTIEDPNSEIDIRPEIINGLKKEVTITKRFIGDIPQDDPELEKILSHFKRHEEIVDEVAGRPHMKLDIEFTVRFITSNQRRINEILNK